MPVGGGLDAKRVAEELIIFFFFFFGITFFFSGLLRYTQRKSVTERAWARRGKGEKR